MFTTIKKLKRFTKTNLIETKRLIIRSFIENDWADLFEYLSLKQIYTYEPGKPITIDESKQIVKDRSKGDDFYAVVLKENMKMIGHFFLQKIQPEHFMTWELGFIFNPIYHNQGYASESAIILVHYAFRVIKAHRIIANCSPENIASWKLLEKIGMRREGHFMKNAFFRKDKNGNPSWFDSYQYAILNDAEHVIIP